jgi:hypothetical protein
MDLNGKNKSPSPFFKGEIPGERVMGTNHAAAIDGRRAFVTDDDGGDGCGGFAHAAIVEPAPDLIGGGAGRLDLPPLEKGD